jgi:hypothetical protein
MAYIHVYNTFLVTNCSYTTRTSPQKNRKEPKQPKLVNSGIVSPPPFLSYLHTGVCTRQTAFSPFASHVPTLPGTASQHTAIVAMN